MAGVGRYIGQLHQVAEAAAEIFQLFEFERLGAQEQHLVFEPGLIECGKTVVVELANVEPDDFSAEAGRKR